MSNYEDYEKSNYSGSPLEAYKFTGTFKNYFYTSADQKLTIDGQLYAPIAIKRNALVSGSQNDSGAEIEITFPYDTEIAQDYAYQVSPPDLSVEIIRYHQNTNPASDWVVLWKGMVTSFSSSGHLIKALVPSIFSIALNGVVPNVYYHAPCNHVLFDDRCKLVSTSYKQDTTVVAVGDTITVADDGFDDEYLRAGEIINTTKSERRLIVDNVSNVLTINFPFFDIEVGDSLTLYAGCNHSFTQCKDKFSNSLNFGGFPYIPTDNPFESEL